MSPSGGQGALADVARAALDTARRGGAEQAAASVTHRRETEVRWRDGQLDNLSEAVTRTLALRLFVDGRYARVSTSDLRPQAVRSFVDLAIAQTRKIARDPLRRLPDPELYQSQAAVDLALYDPRDETVSAIDRRRQAAAIETGARAAERGSAILSVTAWRNDTTTVSHQVHSNGFDGSMRQTRFSAGASVSMRDRDGRRPQDSSRASVRFLADLPAWEALGKEATDRTASRLGARKLPSGILPVVVDRQAADGLVGSLIDALAGPALQQKQSFLDGKRGTAIGSPRLQLTDDPLLPRGLGSRLFDGEGLASHPFSILRSGILEGYYLDTYQARKLAAAPTTGAPSNLAWKLGDKGRAALIAEVQEGVLITGFLGGDANGTTGDFSFGLYGHRIRGGTPAEPVAEMNISGNHLELWKRLAAVGSDPYPYTSFRSPTLVFDGVQLAGA